MYTNCCYHHGAVLITIWVVSYGDSSCLNFSFIFFLFVMIVGNLAFHIEIGKEMTSLFQFVEMQLNTALLHKKLTARVSHEVDSEIVVQSNLSCLYILQRIACIKCFLSILVSCFIYSRILNIA